MVQANNKSNKTVTVITVGKTRTVQANSNMKGSNFVQKNLNTNLTFPLY